MAEVDTGRITGRIWFMRLSYVALGLLVIFFHLLPLQILPQTIAPPDVIVAITFAWAVRRADFVPILLIAAVLLLADMLLQRPPGLWSALVLIGAEWLKSRRKRLRQGSFAEEWFTVSMVLFVITLAYQFVLAVLLVAPGTLVLSMMQFALTLAIYPIVVLASRLIFGLRRPAPGEYGAQGRSI